MPASKDGGLMELSEKMGYELGIDPQYVVYCARRNNLYARYYIDKKGGGKREILQPSKELKVLQHWLVRNIFNQFPVSNFSSAYSKGDSVKKNALIHSASNYILHTDVKSFFTSIRKEMLNKFFLDNKGLVDRMGLSAEDIELILDICLYRGKYLVVGSVASPSIANIFMERFDSIFYEKLSSMGNYKYSRYADDIIVSSDKYINEDVVTLIKNELRTIGLTLNDDKTFFMNKSKKRQVTGVVIDNNTNKISVGNKKYKEIQRAIYKYLVKGQGDIGYLQGYISYIKDLNQEQYEQLKAIYTKYDKKNELFSIKLSK